jgi:hypothetical protein
VRQKSPARLGGRAFPVAIIAFLVAALFTSSAVAGTVFVFTPTNPKPGSKLAFLGALETTRSTDGTIGTYGGTPVPEAATSADLYLVRNADAPSVTQRDDPRLIPIGHYDWSGSSRTCCPTDSHFRIPLKGLEQGVYAVAAWCATCSGQQLVVIGVGDPMHSGDAAALMLLHIQADGFSHWLAVALAAFVMALVLGTLFVVRHSRSPKPQP